MSQSKQNPEQLDCFRITKFDRWEPGKIVTLRIPGGGPLVYPINMAVFAVFFGIPAGFLIHYLFGLFVVEISYLEAMIIGIVPFATLGGIQIAAVDTTSVVEIDWSQNELRTSTSASQRKFNLNDLKSLVVRGLYYTRLSAQVGSSKSTSTQRIYRARLEAKFDNEEVRILHTDAEQDSPEFAVSQIYPLAKELAEAIGVDLNDGEPVKEKHGKLLTSLFKAPAWLSALFVLQIVAAAGFLVWRAEPAIERYRMESKVDQRGGSVSQKSDLLINDQLFGRFGGIHFSEGPIKDEELVELREAFLTWKPFLLDLSETKIADKGLQGIAGNDNLVSINLRETRVTDKGMETLSQCESLVYVNLNRTRVSDKGIEHLTRLKNLKSLHLWGTRVTDQSIPTIAKMNGLREIYLNETRVTPEGLKQLGEQLPETTIYP